MKKKVLYCILLFTFLSFGINYVYSASITTNKESTNFDAKVEQKEESFLLEELLKDKKEQEIVEQMAAKRMADELIKPKTENKLSTLSVKDNIQYKAPVNATLLEGVEGNGYDWYVWYSSTNFTIYKHDVMRNINEEVYNTKNITGNENAHYITYHQRDNVLYILYVKNYDVNAKWGTEYSESWIVGIDLTTNKVVYNGGFECTQNCTYFPSFGVDGEQRFYFVYKNTGTKIFDKTGKLLYDHKPNEDPTGRYINYIKGISPNNKIMFFEAMYKTSDTYAYVQSVYEGMQKLDNGVFVKKDGYTVYGRTYPSSYSKNPVWKFLDSSGIYAADQYGRIAKFNYNDSSGNMGVSREIVVDLNSGETDYTIKAPVYPKAFKNGNYVYIIGSNKNIYKVRYSDFAVESYISLELGTNASIYSMSFYEQSIFVRYYGSGSRYTKQISLDSDNFVAIKNITISEQSAQKHSIEDIVKKYKQTMPTFNYNNSIYETKPSWNITYKAGSLKSGVIKDTINVLNYYRYLVGVDEIGINTDKMSRNQKGAVISKANGTISHYPNKPTDMPEDFYKEAYDGCNAKYATGDTYSGNVSYGDRIPYNAIKGFVSDLNNISYGSATGHRQSMLDPKATAISFGQCEEYTTASVYYDNSKTASQKFYAFPSPGYFPNTEMKINEYWSCYMNPNYTGTVSVKFTYKGKTYKAVDLTFEGGYPVLSFKLPDELQGILGNSNSNMPGGATIQVEIIGLKDENQNNITYRYNVNFFDIKSEIPSKQDIENLIFNYKYYADKYNDLKKAYGYDYAKLKQHWLSCGIKEGRQASPVFNPKYYLYNNEDLKKVYGTENYVSAYNHFINNGWSELRASSDEYCGKYYKNAYSDLSSFNGYRLMSHYINYGKKEGRKATNIIDKTPIKITEYLFDSTFYSGVYNDLKSSYGNDKNKLKQHWTNCGIKEGRTASIVFDPKYYLETYSDLKRAFGNDYKKAYNHFVNCGILEGRKGSRFFDVKYYLATYSDLRNKYGTNYTQALKHFVLCGVREGRAGSESFKVSVYKSNYKDLQNAFGNDHLKYFIHYIKYGLKEKRKAT